MDRWRLYLIAVLGLLVAAGLMAWLTWPRASEGTFDPVGTVITLAGTAVGLAALGLAIRAQRQVDADIISAAARLAVAVGKVETEARWQLLGGHDSAINVQFSFRPAVAHDAAGAGRKGRLEDVVIYYRKLQPGRLVITGSAGSGKTVLAVDLILGLLKDRAANAPVPVRMSAASLDAGRPAESAVAEWLAEHLRQTYGLPAETAGRLVAARMVVPVLDGLDEMDADAAPGFSSRAGRALRACNAFVDGDHKAAMVLTCRTGHYEALEMSREWAHDAARIELLPVKAAAAHKFLTSRASDETRWRPVLDQMRHPAGRPLAAALATPWRLTVAAVVYEQRDPETGAFIREPDDLTDPRFDTESKIRDHLLSLFIPAVVAAHPGHFEPSRVHRWLGELAGYLDGNLSVSGNPGRVVAGQALSGSDLILHKLWPLAGSHRPRVLTAGLIAVIWVALGLFQLASLEHWLTLRRAVSSESWIAAAVVTIGYGLRAWPSPRRADLRQLRTSAGRRKLAVRFATGFAAGFAAGFAYGALYGLAYGFAYGYGLKLKLSLGFAIGFGFVLALGAGAWRGLRNRFDYTAADYSPVKPGQIIRDDLVIGTLFGIAAWIAAGVATILVREFAPRFHVGLGPRFAVVLAGLLLTSLAGWRYITLLLCTRRWNRHWLPWRLGRFLGWCYIAGLVRVAGSGYQFRHRELQDYLARNPQP